MAYLKIEYPEMMLKYDLSKNKETFEKINMSEINQLFLKCQGINDKDITIILNEKNEISGKECIICKDKQTKRSSMHPMWALSLLQTM